MRVAVDTNVLIYAEGVDDLPRRNRARQVLVALEEHDLVLPVQVMGELHRTLIRRGRLSGVQAAERVRYWRRTFQHQAPTTESVFDDALDLVAAHPFQIWDAVILNAAAEAGAALLLSEDITDGFVWHGITVANPFKPEPHPLLADLLIRRPQ